ncbi:MAG: tRNA (guanosine(46)-N7)-methyltransferase TrmB [Eubacteriales bacterium]|nr:tRNA (guanosine(46)-N7)-methyltransferase TrmB [Eubacteriales bacterium]MDD3199976.1 tRNA (guanosine(46)-N7)-methyltransferase TrmB [Eubacteriales bacterium]MDD4630201.1 tRNA (guanosine(46)-N7)-methyltransferase TrmB [Eubacteriales bacterium]
MRQRKVKNEEERLSEHHRYLIQQPQEKKNRWHEVFNNSNEIFAEFGCGRGQFILTLAKLNPDRNYIAFEGRGSIILRALEKAEGADLKNVMFIKEYINDVNEYFEENELSGIYLNFSDPWPKDRHSKRRLTHRRYLEGYQKVLKNGSHIEFKSDNSDFFLFALNEFKNCGMKLHESTMDLHGTKLEAAKVTTEYEDKFKAAGKEINYCKVQV